MSEEQYQLDALDPIAVSRLNDIIAATSALVVLSSTWRLDTPLTKMTRLLRYRGFAGHLFAATPYIASGTRHVRGDEVRWWLNKADSVSVESYVILDDDDDFDGLNSRLVLTQNSVGLTDADVRRAIDILSVNRH
jgi:hypothetical protein